MYFYTNYYYTKIHWLSDSSGYFIIGYKAGVSHATIWKLLFSNPNSSQWQELSGMSEYAFGQLMLNDNQFYFVTGIHVSGNSLYFVKFTFGSAYTDWVNTLSIANYYGDLSESLVSNDNTKIFSFFVYGGSSFSMYFATFNLQDGNLIGSRYKSSASCSIFKIYGSAQKGDFIILTTYCDPSYYLVMMNSVSYTFTMMKFSGSNLFGAAVQQDRL